MQNFMKAAALKRLVYDLREVIQNPFENVVARPVADNLFMWHGNVRSSEGELDGLPIHFVLRFPETYPSKPPECDVLTRIPHPMVSVSTREIHLEGGEEVLEGHRVALWDCVPGRNTWTSAYGVLSTLIQLQVFLLREDLLYDTGSTTRESAIERVQSLRCPICDHTSSVPKPSFATADDIATAAHSRYDVLPSKPFVSARCRAAALKREANEHSGEGEVGAKRKRDDNNEEHPTTPPTAAPTHPHNSTTLAPSNLTTTSQPRVRTSFLATLRTPHATLISNTITSALAPPKQSTSDTTPVPLLGLNKPIGLFSLLDGPLLLAILHLLSPADLASLSASCKGLQLACQDSTIWLGLIARHCAKRKLVSCSQVIDWRQAFKLEASHVASDLRCFHTKCNWDETIICLPLRKTMNPVTGVVDYIEAYPYTISLDAYRAGVRVSPAGEPIDDVLPLYISDEHFQRALPHLTRLLPRLAPENFKNGTTNSASYRPELWIKVLAKILNTSAVLLCDNGVKASDHAIVSFCAVHRLLLALCERYNLWSHVKSQLDTFLSSPYHRTKSSTPNLGWLLPLLSLSPSHTWQRVAPAVIAEMLDRSVLWICKSDPSLVTNFQVGGCSPHRRAQQLPPTTASEVDETLLEGAFHGTSISRRLLMFHVAFLQLVACPPGMTLEHVMDSYDSLYGRPGAGLTHRFQTRVKEILAVTNWSDCWRLLGMTQHPTHPTGADGEDGEISVVDPNPHNMTHHQKGKGSVESVMSQREPSAAELTCMLRKAWWNSLEKGYHRKGMDFSRVHASGVSRILLKGDSHSAPPGMRRMQLVDNWSWPTNLNRTQYLDATCLLYGRNHRFIELLDFEHTQSTLTMVQGAVTHSGDVTNDNGVENSMSHTMDIRLNCLGQEVEEIWLVLSSFRGPLANIKLPFVQVTDPKTQMVVCEYHLEELPAEDQQRYSSVVMARVYCQPSGQWAVQAIGRLGHGRAREYEPIKAMVETCWREVTGGQGAGAHESRKRRYRG